MSRVVCNACKGRGHFGRDCPLRINRNQPKNCVETDICRSGAGNETETETEKIFLSFHEDELRRRRVPRRVQRPAKAPDHPDQAKKGPNPTRDARYIGRYTASAARPAPIKIAAAERSACEKYRSALASAPRKEELRVEKSRSLRAWGQKPTESAPLRPEPTELEPSTSQRGAKSQRRATSRRPHLD